MGYIRRQSILSLLFSYIGVAIGYINWGIFLPLILTPSLYGLIKFVRDTSVFFSKLSHAGILHGVLKFFPKFSKSNIDRDRFFSFALSLLTIASVIIALILFVFKSFFIGIYKKSAPLVEDYYFYLIPFIFIFLIIDIFFTFFSINKKSSISFFFRDTLLRILVLILICLYYFSDISFELFLQAFIGIHAVIAVIHIVAFSQKFNLKLRSFQINTYRSKGFLEFSFYNFSTSILSLLTKYIDSFMITAYLGLKYNGIYGLAFLIASIIEYPRVSIINNIVPEISFLINENKFDKIRQLNRRAASSLLLLGCFTFLLIQINVESFLSLLKPEYSEGIMVIVWIGLARVIRLSTGVAYETMLNSRYYKYNIPISLFSLLVIVVTNVILIPKYGIIGAAAGSLFSILITNALIIALVYIKLSINPYTLKSLYSVILLGLLIFIMNIIDLNFQFTNNLFIDTSVNILVRSLFATVIFWTISIKLNLSSDLTNTYKLFIEKVKEKF